MLQRTKIAIQDTARSATDIEELRNALNAIANIADSHLTMNNRVVMKDGTFRITDFVIEVDDTYADDVRRAITRSGFTLRRRPLLEQADVCEAVRELVEYHRTKSADHSRYPLKFAIWFRLEDPSDVHLLEICDNVLDPGDGSLQGISLGAADTVPGAKSIVIYLVSPMEFRKALKVNQSHAAVIAIRERDCKLVYPEDDWERFTEEFPEVK